MDKLDDADVTYPAMFYDISSVTFQEKQIEFRFDIYLMDRHLVETQAEEVLSDMILVSRDIISNLRVNSNSWLVDTTINTEIFREDSPDFLAGIKLDIGLTISSINDTCIIPN